MSQSDWTSMTEDTPFEPGYLRRNESHIPPWSLNLQHPDWSDPVTIDLAALRWCFDRARIKGFPVEPGCREIRLRLVRERPWARAKVVIVTAFAADGYLVFNEKMADGDARSIHSHFRLRYRQTKPIPRSWRCELASVAAVLVMLTLFIGVVSNSCRLWNGLPWCEQEPPDYLSTISGTMLPQETATPLPTVKIHPLSETVKRLGETTSYRLSPNTLETLDVLLTALDAEWEAGPDALESLPFEPAAQPITEGSVNVIPSLPGVGQGPCRAVLIVVNWEFASFEHRLTETDSHLLYCPEAKLVVFISDYWNDARYTRHCAAQPESSPWAPEMVVLLRMQGSFRVLPVGTYTCPTKDERSEERQ